MAICIAAVVDGDEQCERTAVEGGRRRGVWASGNIWEVLWVTELMVQVSRKSDKSRQNRTGSATVDTGWVWDMERKLILVLR